MAIMRDVSWHLELVEPPTTEPITVTEVLTDHLRSPNVDEEQPYAERLLKTARIMAERSTRRALMPQTWDLVMDGFPYPEILVPRPPLIEIVSITYVDADGVEQTLDAADYQVSAPKGPRAGRGRIRPAYGKTWPSTRAQMDAVTVTFEAGYESVGSPASPDVPDDIIQGMLLVVGELYKQRSESVHAFNQNPALIRARDIWLGYRVY